MEFKKINKSVKWFQKIIYYLKQNNIDYVKTQIDEISSLRFNYYVFVLVNGLVLLPSYYIFNPDSPIKHKIFLLKRIKLLYEQQFKTNK